MNKNVNGTFSALRHGCIVAAVYLLTSHAQAFDARSVAMGQTGVTAGKGVNGAMQNPALLVEQQRKQERFHMRFGMAVQAIDQNESAKKASDNEDLVDALDAEIDVVTERTDPSAQCLATNPVTGDGANPSAVCVEQTQKLAGLSSQVLDLLNDVDEQPIDVIAQGDLGLSVLTTSVPFAVNVMGRGTLNFLPDVSDSDIGILSGYVDALEDGQVTRAEVDANENITISGTNVEFALLDDELDSTATGAAVLRAQVALVLASTFEVSGINVDVGVTPKFSQLRAGDVEQSLNDSDDDEDIEDQIEASEVTESSVTFDLGIRFDDASRAGVSYGAVVRNVIAESITTRNGFEFETTPQLIASAMWDKGWYLLTADAAVNKAKVDSIETQKLAVGSEFSWKILQFRLGVSHDMALDLGSKTQFSAGLGIGFFDIGASYNGDSSYQVGTQIAFGF